MVDVEKEMMKEIMADYHSGDPRKVASAKRADFKQSAAPDHIYDQKILPYIYTQILR